MNYENAFSMHLAMNKLLMNSHMAIWFSGAVWCLAYRHCHDTVEIGTDVLDNIIRATSFDGDLFETLVHSGLGELAALNMSLGYD